MEQTDERQGVTVHMSFIVPVRMEMEMPHVVVFVPVTVNMFVAKDIANDPNTDAHQDNAHA